MLSGIWYIISMETGVWPAPTAWHMLRPSPSMPGMAKEKRFLPQSRPMVSLIISVLWPKPPVATMTEEQEISYSSPFLSLAVTPTTAPSSLVMRPVPGHSSMNSTPSSWARSVMRLVIVVAARGPGSEPSSGWTTCQVYSPSA